MAVPGHPQPLPWEPRQEGEEPLIWQDRKSCPQGTREKPNPRTLQQACGPAQQACGPAAGGLSDGPGRPVTWCSCPCMSHFL